MAYGDPVEGSVRAMPFAVAFVIFVVMVVIGRVVSRGATPSGAALGPVSGNGLLARGLILHAYSTATEGTLGGQRVEYRRLRLDVEVPGQAPYEVSVTPAIPRICEALPGATLDLRVNPRDPNDITVVGPAGASGWIGAAGSIPGQTWGPRPLLSRLPRGCGVAFVLVVGGGLLVGAIVSFASGARRSSSPERPAATHPAPPRPAPAPHKPGPHR
jgi:hypothetical protein